MLDKIKIGHFTDSENATGCTVILPSVSNVASASVRGAAPGTRELALLAPEKKIPGIHGLLLTGGSAYGLGGAHQLMLSLRDAGIGYKTDYGLIPLVSAAVIFDKNIANSEAYPTDEHVKQAFHSASYNERSNGSIGAGTGATIGKWKGIDHAMKAGLGIYEHTYGDLNVTALSVVNAVGDVFDTNGNVLAGAVDDQTNFYAEKESAFRWEEPRVGFKDNTVLTVIMTNAALTKLQAFQAADHAHYGLARRIKPSHTSYDGDVAFTIAIPEIETSLDLVYTMVTEAVEESIIQGVKKAEGMHGMPSVRELGLI